MKIHPGSRCGLLLLVLCCGHAGAASFAGTAGQAAAVTDTTIGDFLPQPITFWSQSGSHPSVDGTLNGAIINDHLASGDYTGYIGEMILMPTDPEVLSGVAADEVGVATGDVDGTFDGFRGMVGFCIDSETPFQTSSSQGQTYTYVPLDFVTANQRYLDEGVSQYLGGSLKRAAYLIEQFIAEVFGVGDVEAAAMQAAIWEVLYDAQPDLSTGSGSYYVRNNVGDTATRLLANQVISIANQWFAEAEAADWGGPDYDPTGRVAFWVNPTNSQINQSIITLIPVGSSLLPIPEPGSAALCLLGLAPLWRRRR